MLPSNEAFPLSSRWCGCTLDTMYSYLAQLPFLYLLIVRRKTLMREDGIDDGERLERVGPLVHVARSLLEVPTSSCRAFFNSGLG